MTNDERAAQIVQDYMAEQRRKYPVERLPTLEEIEEIRQRIEIRERHVKALLRLRAVRAALREDGA